MLTSLPLELFQGIQDPDNRVQSVITVMLKQGLTSMYKTYFFCSLLFSSSLFHMRVLYFGRLS